MTLKLESVITRLHEEIRRDPTINQELFAEMLEKERRLGIVHDKRPFCPFLRPYFLGRSRYTKIVGATETLSSAFETLTKAALEYDEILAELDLTEREQQMARIEPGYSQLCVSSRMDAFLNGDEFKFLEYNAETPAGITDQMQIEKVLQAIAPVRKFLSETKHWRPVLHLRLLESLVAAYRDFGGKKEKPNIAIVDWDGVSTASEFLVIQEFFESEGFQTVIGDPRELEYDGEILRLGDFAIDIFYKRIIIHELLEKFDESSALCRAYRDGNVCMANSFRTKIPHKKAGFAVLSDEKYAKIFTAEQLEAIRKHIPWTRRLREEKTDYQGAEVDLLEFIRRERSKFLLKPNDDYGGKGIKCGWESSESEWDAALNEALSLSYIVQERANVGKETIPVFTSGEVRLENLLVDFDPFLFMGKVEGGLVRLSASQIVNVSQGGGETALFVLEDF